MTLRRRGLITHAQDLAFYSVLLGLGLLVVLCEFGERGVLPVALTVANGAALAHIDTRTASQPLTPTRSTSVAVSTYGATVAASGTWGCRRGGSSARSRRQQVRAVVRGGGPSPKAVRASARRLARLAPSLPGECGLACGQRVAARAAGAVARKGGLMR